MAVTSPASGAGLRFESEVDLTIGGQYVNRDEWDLTADDDAAGELFYQKNEKSGFYLTTALDGDFRAYKDIKENIVLDFRTQWNVEMYDPQAIASRRYNIAYGDTELDFGYSPGKSTLWMAKIFHRLDKEELLPLVEANTFGAEGSLDKSLGDHAFLNFKIGLQDTSFQDSETRWDNNETYLRMVYTNIGPERSSIDSLPSDPDRYTSDPDLFFQSSDLLGLWRSRPLIASDGQARRILENIPMAPPPPTQDLKVQVNIPGSIFAGGLGLTSRDYTNLGNQSFIRADASAFMKWELGNRVNLTLDENLYWQDYNYEDDTLLLYDHFKNDLNLYLSHSNEKEYLSVGFSVKHLFFDEATQWDLATTKFYGGWDYRQNKKYSYSLRGSYQKDMPDETRPYNEYTKEMYLFGAFRLHFDSRSLLRLSLEKEKEIVTKTQSEFDSSFDCHKYGVRYEKNLSSQITWQAGYSFERERHEIFYKNNRDEEIGYINLCLHI